MEALINKMAGLSDTQLEQLGEMVSTMVQDKVLVAEPVDDEQPYLVSKQTMIAELTKLTTIPAVKEFAATLTDEERVQFTPLIQEKLHQLMHEAI